MANWTELLELPVYQLNKADKKALFSTELFKLSQHHYQSCLAYRRIIDAVEPRFFFKENQPPIALAANIFKHHFLSSVEQQNIAKITTSSGTTSAQVSKIALDKENIARQQRVLTKIIKQWLGKKRLPMLIIDHPNVIKDKRSYSARGVGIQGLSLFGYHHTYALNEDMSINEDAITEFFSRYQNEKVFIFGFTFMVWQYFVKALQNLARSYPFKQGILLHSGGWKKLQQQAVSNDIFKQQTKQVLGNIHIHNFYGMVEQTGTVYVECEQGHLHCPVWSDIQIINVANMQELPKGERGVIQVNSLLPTSYPGHAIITEDIGILLGEDDCQCGRKGKYFSVLGRIEQAQVRGCSDTQN
ncbi:acyl-protein synthetase [Thalassotalea sp. G2M2-11]|uniref:LuxE/PaaK family acyltransferase n=1 Tax=Thalassotalea sp. G2M2-11 TaxID=2787627 RepID=UPI0019D24494|nr:acyl-protein synthetase [Thalassotalea sp. G2M2-11]